MRKKLKLIAVAEERTIADEFWGRQVMCRNCKGEYICGQGQEYYAATAVTDGLCLKCLFKIPLFNLANRSATNYEYK